MFNRRSHLILGKQHVEASRHRTPLSESVETVISHGLSHLFKPTEPDDTTAKVIYSP
jgi:hypothetical protein